MLLKILSLKFILILVSIERAYGQTCSPSCLNNGLCVQVGANPVCACSGGFTGNICQNAPVTSTTTPIPTTASTCNLKCLNGLLFVL